MKKSKIKKLILEQIEKTGRIETIEFAEKHNISQSKVVDVCVELGLDQDTIDMD